MKYDNEIYARFCFFLQKIRSLIVIIMIIMSYRHSKNDIYGTFIFIEVTNSFLLRKRFET